MSDENKEEVRKRFYEVLNSKTEKDGERKGPELLDDEPDTEDVGLSEEAEVEEEPEPEVEEEPEPDPNMVTSTGRKFDQMRRERDKRSLKYLGRRARW